jgi:endonuclease/exonuclease/phosphatase family metal-dependent hydrolase
MTWNLWKINRKAHDWERRRPAMKEVVARVRPDILAVQELCPEYAEALLEALPSHNCVNPGPDDCAGWKCEGNIVWNKHLLEYEAHGALEIGMVEAERRLFWVRLRGLGAHSGVRLIVASVHFTWQGSEKEIQVGQNPRIDQSRQCVCPLEELAEQAGTPKPAVLLMGDMNEAFHTRRVLTEEGFCDCFRELGIPAQPTHPQRPCSDPEEEEVADQALDWIFALREPKAGKARCVLANVLKNAHGAGGVFPSDHMPVAAVYEIEPESA